MKKTKFLRQRSVFVKPMHFLAFLLLSFSTVAQNVSGTISDDIGNRLANVSVNVKGTNNGTVSDVNGNFSINAPKGSSLQFSYVGYNFQEVKVAGSQNLVVIMNTEGQKSLGEVVVTALGIKRDARKIGYAAETVKVDELRKNPTTNLMTNLEGKISGLDISPPSAGAAASNKIRLRGQSGFAGANNAPLIVLNGLPMDQGASSANGDQQVRDNGDNLLLFNPDDVESMTVLKGATAAALYGSRAANGAIIITTKNGSKNAGLGVEYTTNYSTDKALDFTDFQYEFGQGANGVRPTSGANAASTGQLGWGERYDGAPTFQFDGVQRPYSPIKNRIDEFYRTGTTFTNTIAVSNGGPKGSFRASFTHQDAKGIMPNNTYNKKIFNLGVNQNIGDKLTLSVNANFTNDKNINPPQVGVQGINAMNFLVRTSPVTPLSAYRENAVDANGNEAQTTGFTSTIINPYWIMPRQRYINRKDQLLATTTLRYQIFEWLYLQGRMNMDFNSSSNEQNNVAGTGRPGNAQFYDASRTTFGGSYDVSQGKGRQMNYDFLLGGNRKFGDFSLDLSVGGNIYTSQGSNVRINAQSFIVRNIYTVGNATIFAPGYDFSKKQVNSLYSFAELGFKNFLYLNVTGRNDWFSTLNPKNNNYFYPSFSGSFVFSEILKSPSWLNFGKFRASYADVGSDNGINPYYGLLTYNFNQQLYNGYSIGSIAQGNNPNQNIKPFSVKEKEVGLELKMFGNRVNLDIAAYEKKTSDQIVDVQNSLASGYDATKLNFGSLKNSGIEVLLELVPVKTRNFTWTSAFNTAYNTSKVLSLAPGVKRFVAQDWYNGGASNEFIGKLVYEVGLPLNQISARTYKRNANGDILLSSGGRLLASSAEVNFGSALPKYTGGWNNNFRYKALSLLVLIDYKAGGKILSGSALNALRQGHSKASLVGRRAGENGVVFDGIYDNGANAGKPNTTAVFGSGFYADYRGLQIADPFIYKSDFIKLRNITLSYDFSKFIGSQVKFVKGLSLSATCRNVAILKKYIPDVDPEAVASSGDFRSGYEAVSLPTTRTYGINLNIKF